MKTTSTVKRKLTGFILVMKGLFLSFGVRLDVFLMERFFPVNSVTDVAWINILYPPIIFAHKRAVVRIRYRYRFAPFPGKLAFWFQGNRSVNHQDPSIAYLRGKADMQIKKTNSKFKNIMS